MYIMAQRCGLIEKKTKRFFSLYFLKLGTTGTNSFNKVNSFIESSRVKISAKDCARIDVRLETKIT